MYGVSQKYKDAIYNNSRTIGWEGTVTLTDGTVINVGTNNMASGGISVARELFNNDMPWVGGTCAAQLDLSIISAQNRMAFYGARVEMSFILYFDDGTNEKVPLGVYYVTEVERSSGNKINLTCFDAMQKFEVPAAVNVSGYAYDIIAYYCGICGVPLAQTREFIESHFTNTGVDLVSFVGDNSIATARQGLGYVLSIIGANAEIDRLGRLNLIADSTEEYATITFDDSNRFNTDISDFSVAIKKIEAINPDTGDAITFGNEQIIGSNVGYSLDIGANPFLPIDENEIAAVVSSLFDSVRSNPTTPFELKIPTDPSIDLGDHVEIPVRAGMIVAVATGIIGKISYKAGGAMTISGIGVFPSANKTTNERTISGVNNEVRIGSIYYYDYVNASNIAIGDGDSETIMEINYGIGEATHIDFHGQAKLYVTTTEAYDAQTETYTIGDCVVTATIYVDDVEQDFHPEWILDDGENTIDFLHFYDIDVAGDASTLKVDLEVNGCSVEIAAGDSLGYICGAHFADEVTRLFVDQMPNKVNYQNGERTDYTGAKIVASMKSGKRIDVTDSCEFDPANDTLIDGYDESATLNVNVNYADRENKTWRTTIPLEVKVPPMLTMKNIPLLKTDGFDSDFTSDIFYNPTSEYLMLSNIPNENTGQVLINKLSSDYAVDAYNYIPFHATAGPQAFVTDAGSSDATMMGMFTHPYLYNGSWRRDQYTLYDSTTDSVRVSEASHNVGNWIYRTDFTLVGIVPNDIAVNSDKVMLVALTETKVITKSGTTYNIPFFWYWPNTSLQFYNYIWGVQGQSGMFYSGFAFDHQDNDRLYAIKQNGTTLSVIEADYSELDNDVDNARSYDFLTAIQTFKTLTGNYNISLHERIYAANGLVAWAIIDEDNNTNTLYVANATTGVVQTVAQIADNSLAFGGFDYCADLEMWFALFGNKGYASTDGTSWTEVKLERDGGGAITLHGNNFVLKDTMIYISNAGLYGGDLADIDI